MGVECGVSTGLLFSSNLSINQKTGQQVGTFPFQADEKDTFVLQPLKSGQQQPFVSVSLS